tara:strand:+ start:513 stop:743 length:231 start_codon:yes stop_codon:yes gene_type:complete
MEFPNEIWKEIFTYYHSSIRKPLHVTAIQNDDTFRNFVIDRELYYEDGELPEWDTSYVDYVKWVMTWHPLPEQNDI